MNKMAFETVEKNAGKIAIALLEAAEKGNVQSARLLFELAEGNVGDREAAENKPLFTLAMRLAAEPQAMSGLLDKDAYEEEETPELVKA